MRPLILSNCEKEFILRSLLENSRVDGRSCTDYRNIAITLGEDHGSCLVAQANTKVFAQVSCRIVPPKPARPAEGSLHVNLELSPMAAPHFESGRLGDIGVEICRLLERNLKQSECLDLESLCIVAGEQVWEVRIDIHVLDYDGAVVDAASVAAVCALRHFRKPDVTLSGKRVLVHSVEDKEPVPLNLLHYPLCVTFGFCDQGRVLVVDMTEKEEQVVDGKLVIAMNSHRELCTIHCSGNALFRKEQVLRCTSKAAQRVKELTEMINKVFEQRAKPQSESERDGFTKLIGVAQLMGTAQNETIRQPRLAKVEVGVPETTEIKPVTISPKIIRKGKVARVATSAARLPTENDSDVEIIDEFGPGTAPVAQSEGRKEDPAESKRKRRGKSKQVDKDVQLLLNEIEDDVQVLLPTESGYKTSSKPEDTEQNIEIIDLAGALRPSKPGRDKHKHNK